MPSSASSTPPSAEPGAGRLLGFSDGVVAIAATLLVLPLVDLAPDHAVDNIGQLLLDNRSALFAFVLSFAVIYRFWLLHHRIFASVRRPGTALVWLNGLWLLSIVFLPFPTQLIGGQHAGDRVAWGLYTGTMLVTSATSAACLWLIRRDATAGEPAPPPHTLVVTGALAVAFLLALTVPGAGPWSLLLLLPASLAQRSRHRR